MRVKLNTYRISLTNRAGEKQILDYFNGEDDFLIVVNNYCNHVLQNVRNYIDGSGNLRTFTLGDRPNLVEEERYINGYFDSAYTGEIVDIKERQTNDILYTVTPDKLQSKKFFFNVSVPINSKYAYLVVQRKANHGIKNILETSFSEYFRYLGYEGYKIQIEEAPSFYLLENMLENGRLKDIKLLDNSLLSSFQEQFNNVGAINNGSFEKILKFNRDSNTIMFKEVLFRLYRQNYHEEQQIELSGEFFDEVSFTIEFNNLSKTFYVKKKEKIRSNVDITDLVEIENGEPTRVSILNVSLNIIRRLLDRNNGGLEAA